MQSYKTLKVWQKAHELVLWIYEMTNSFPKQEIFGLTPQIRRSSVSIAANLAEGCGKSTSKDIANFFQVSLGSLHETEYYILLAKDLAYISIQDFQKSDDKTREVKAMLVSLIKTVRNS
ncbi:four helix bundle protein [Persicitalea jodogahamensis]|uniref:Four helix bundle protein n=1 Tax=Persicitalea jodogahamensis TaxID=402147 RepID=A0A8J3GA44_9BACT|nr:four helix bundle protein [Persicitalea jodogahamensis]GHB77870.1 four helix bundle protein [Persicitalea jodogahamensis]